MGDVQSTEERKPIQYGTTAITRRAPASSTPTSVSPALSALLEGDAVNHSRASFSSGIESSHSGNPAFGENTEVERKSKGKEKVTQADDGAGIPWKEEENGWESFDRADYEFQGFKDVLYASSVRTLMNQDPAVVKTLLGSQPVTTVTLIGQASEGAPSASASAPYVLHVVTDADTLEGLALRYGVKVAEIKRVNKLWTKEELFARKCVVIPRDQEGYKRQLAELDENKKKEMRAQFCEIVGCDETLAGYFLEQKGYRIEEALYRYEQDRRKMKEHMLAHQGSAMPLKAGRAAPTPPIAIAAASSATVTDRYQTAATSPVSAAGKPATPKQTKRSRKEQGRRKKELLDDHSQENVEPEAVPDEHTKVLLRKVSKSTQERLESVDNNMHEL